MRPYDQHGYPIREREHRRHVVLDQNDRKAALDAVQGRNQSLGFLAAGAGHRLVEQQQFRLHRERHREFQHALFAVGEMRGAECRARSASPTSASAASAGSFKARSDAARRKKRKLVPARACTASATFSSAENPGSTDVIWNDRAMPSAARAHAADRRGDVATVEHDVAGIGLQSVRKSG